MRSSTAKGWNVYEFRGQARLELRQPGLPKQTVILPFDWAKASVGDVLTRVRNIYPLVAEGHSLKAAAEIADGKAPKPLMDWAGAVERFKQQKMEHGRAVKPITWNHSYAPVLNDAVAALTSKRAPTSPADLVDQMIRRWATGSRMRQIRAQSLAQFLRYCVSREGFPAVWMPPTDLRAHVGSTPTEELNRSKGDPVEDQQIINLLSSLPGDAAGQRWSDALKLLAELGLRPIELVHLSVQKDRSSGQPYWWCSYRKRSGGGDTEPRRVHPLPLVDAEGQVQRWNLLERWQAGLIELPPLTSGAGAGDALGTYLSRQPGWCSLKALLAAKGERLVPYSFRHSYSLRGHLRGIDAGSVALSMGHSFEVHCRAYPWASQSGTAAAFERANAALLTSDLASAR
ncbi:MULTISPECIES: site-specific integrase [unclassified Cyanobium]|uniref:site-specific integrase n=1 Tax=unclassified Cyanobium TaxID=2627006 RepID=UPI0020CC6639|nr:MULTISPECIES: site-specific integrase [unclassified Cyanobium]